MKIILIGDEVLPKEKIMNLLSADEVVKDKESPEKIHLYNSNHNIEEFFNELEIREDYLDKIKTINPNSEVVVIISRETITSSGSGKEENGPRIVEYKDIRILLDNEEVYCKNQRVRLTALEYRLLLFFVTNPKKLISRQEIINYIWGKNNTQNDPDNSIYTHVKNLKKKISNTGCGNFFHSVYGQGYRFDDSEQMF